MFEMNPEDDVPHDEDVIFEKDEAVLIPLTDSPDAVVSSTPAGETILPPKEETLGKSDFPPLTEEEKLPKIEEDLSPNL